MQRNALPKIATLRPLVRTAGTMATAAFWLLATVVFLNDNVAEVNPITGTSMAPSISPQHHETGAKDYLAVSKFQPAAALHRGDVVTFDTPHNPHGNAVKRVIGLEGDTVYLNPRRRPHDEVAARAWDQWQGRVLVPYGHVWVEGDNWRASKDSNHYGPISKSLITGKALWVVWPYARFRTKPWEGFKVRTRVLPGRMEVPAAWRDG